MGDWADHLTTAFPEVRLKQLPRDARRRWRALGRLCALPALWVGLLYDSRRWMPPGIWCKDWTVEEREALRREVPRQALDAVFRGRKLARLAREVLRIARDGLTRRRKLDRMGGDESHFLNALDRIADSGKTPAQEKLALFHGRWKGSVDPVFGEFAY